MERSQQKKYVKKSYPYFRKQATITKKGDFETVSSRDRYTLCSVASMDSSILDTYLCYFGGFYNRKYHQETRKKSYLSYNVQYCLSHFSECFKTYLKIVLSKMMINSSVTSVRIADNIIEELRKSAQNIENCHREPGKNLKEMSREMEATVDAAVKFVQYLLNLTSIQKLSTSRERSFKEFKKIQDQCQLQVKDLKKLLRDNESVRKLESLPSQVKSRQQVCNYVEQNFKRIGNIILFTQANRKAAAKRLQGACSEYYTMKIDILQPKDLDPLQAQSTINCIEVTRPSEDQKPVLTVLIDYVRIRQRRLRDCAKDLSVHNKQLTAMTVKQLSVYHTKTRTFYPYITARDVFFNQRTNKIELDPKKVILEGIGLRGATEHTELRVATRPTPQLPDTAKAWVEDISEVWWELIKHLYFPNTAPSDEEQPSQSRPRDYSLMNIAEQVHSWRVICLAYFTLNGRHLLIDRMKKELQQESKCTTANVQQIERQRKEVWKGLQDGSIKISSLMSGSGEEPSRMDLNLREIQKYYNINTDEDSLVENMHCDKVKFELYARNSFTPEIKILLQNSQYFHKVRNVQKFLLVFNAFALEEAYQIVVLIWKEKLKSGSRLRIIQKLKESFKGSSFNGCKEMRRRSITLMVSKIKEYYGRGEAQYQGIYLHRIQPLYFNMMLESQSELQSLFDRQQYLNSLEGAQKYTETSQSQEYQQIMTLMEKSAAKIIENSITIVQEMVSNDLQRQYHKDAKYAQKIQMTKKLGVSYAPQLPQMLLRSLLLTLRAAVRMNTHNWKKFDSLIIPLLSEGQMHEPLSRAGLDQNDIRRMREKMKEMEQMMITQPVNTYEKMRLRQRPRMSLWEKYDNSLQNRQRKKDMIGQQQ